MDSKINTIMIDMPNYSMILHDFISYYGVYLYEVVLQTVSQIVQVIIPEA